MLQFEFEERVKMHVTPQEYSAIEVVYNNAEVDKDEFCKMWAKMNRSRIKRAQENSKKAKELAELREKIWHIYEKVKNIPYSQDYQWAIEKLSARDITTISKAGIIIENYCIGSFRGKLYDYLHQA